MVNREATAEILTRAGLRMADFGADFLAMQRNVEDVFERIEDGVREISGRAVRAVRLPHPRTA